MPRPSRTVSSGSWSGRRKRSTAGYRRRRSTVSSARTEQPVSTTRSAGLAAFRRLMAPMRPMTLCSAASRMAQLLMTTRSADSSPSASAQPAASSAPAISSESEWFIWQPRVQTWNRGSTWSSVRNSDTRGSTVGRRPDRVARRAPARARASAATRRGHQAATPMACSSPSPTASGTHVRDATSAYATSWPWKSLPPVGTSPVRAAKSIIRSTVGVSKPR